MSFEVFTKEVACSECGLAVEYVVQHPPIPMIVRGFYSDEGRPIGDDCPRCDAPLPVPPEAP